MRTLLIGLIFLLLPVSAPSQEPTVKPATKEPEVEMTTYYMVFLRIGPKWTKERTPEAKAAFEGHMANMRRLAAEGKLVIAGPFLDKWLDPPVAGIQILRVGTMEEAKALAETDPAVKAGRFSYDIVRWMGPKTLRY